MQKTGHSTPLS